MDEYYLSDKYLRHEFDGIRSSQTRQAERELKLLADHPDSIVCQTCNGVYSSMGGRKRGSLHQQAFCKCNKGVMDFEMYAEYARSTRAKYLRKPESL